MGKRTSQLADMFTTLYSLNETLGPSVCNSWIMLANLREALYASSSHFEPVQDILPVEKICKVQRGSRMRMVTIPPNLGSGEDGSEVAGDEYEGK